MRSSGWAWLMESNARSLDFARDDRVGVETELGWTTGLGRITDWSTGLTTDLHGTVISSGALVPVGKARNLCKILVKPPLHPNFP